MLLAALEDARDALVDSGPPHGVRQGTVQHAVRVLDRANRQRTSTDSSHTGRDGLTQEPGAGIEPAAS